MEYRGEPDIQNLLVQADVAGNNSMKIYLQKDEPFVYYTGAAWDKAGLIIHSQDWFTYLQLFQQKLKQPLLVKLL